MAGVKLGEIFPTLMSAAIFMAYMALSVNQGLLVTASRYGSDRYPYNPTLVVLLTESMKLIVAIATYSKEHGLKAFSKEITINKYLVGYYMIPAFLYTLYNNLAFSNLAVFDPTTYFIFMQIRLAVTGLVFQFLMNRRLSTKQWIAILMLTFGCMIQKLKHPDVTHSSPLKPEKSPETQMTTFELIMWMITIGSDIILVMVQVLCSVVAGVYTEYIIKRVAGEKTDIMVNNFFMYSNSIFCNILVLVCQVVKGLGADDLHLLKLLDLTGLFSGFALLIVINNASLGVVTSLFLKHHNSILKAFASAIELVFTAILSFILLGIPIYGNTIVAVVVVSGAVVLYAQNPVSNKVEDTNDMSESNASPKKVIVHPSNV